MVIGLSGAQFGELVGKWFQIGGEWIVCLWIVCHKVRLPTICVSDKIQETQDWKI